MATTEERLAAQDATLAQLNKWMTTLPWMVGAAWPGTRC
jgi:uncharacterized coiled-coil protein SlyX